MGGAAAKSFSSIAFSTCSTFSFLLLLEVVSTGSTANFLTFFTVSSIGVGSNRDRGGGDVADMIVKRIGWQEEEMEMMNP